MPKRVKSFKLSEECITELEQRAQAENISQAAYVEKVLLGNTKGNTKVLPPQNTNDHTTEALVKQLEVKDEQLRQRDEQITHLTAALVSAQDTAKAAQALHAADVAPSLALESQEQKQSRWERLKAAWRG